jgi:hypothetical protein
MTSNDEVAPVGVLRFRRFVLAEASRFELDSRSLPVMLSVRNPPIAPAAAVVSVVVPENTVTDWSVVRGSMTRIASPKDGVAQGAKQITNIIARAIRIQITFAEKQLSS